MASAQARFHNSQPLDLLIIGAGIYGIQAARTYLTIHATHNILILEADDAPGGVWSKKRMYPQFITQSPLDIWEFSDKPLSLNDEEAKNTFHEHFPAEAFARYLEEYIDGHIFDGKSLRSCILCNSRVEKLIRNDNVWLATTSTKNTYTARKVIDATGLTSLPKIPKLDGSFSFRGLQLHSRDFGLHSPAILIPQTRIVIIGGGKSAGDMAYACAKAGVKEINWVIRRSGNGPAAYIPADVPIKKYGNSNAAFHTTIMSSILASVYVPETWWTWFLYRTFIGRFVHKLIWKGLQLDAYSRAKYDRANETGFKNLKPDGDMSMFWQVAGSGVNQRPDFFDLLAERVHVYRQDIARLTPNGIILADGTSLAADAIIYATGWLSTTPYLDPKTAHALGHTASLTATDDDDDDRWTALENQAETQILQRFPILASPPPFPTPTPSPPPPPSPFRLYRSIFPTAPCSPPSIAFLGRTVLANHTYTAEVQALYCISVLDGVTPLPSQYDMETDVARVNAWMKRRYPTQGGSGNFLFFDVVGYTDLLLGDLDMGYVREARGLWGPMRAGALREMVERYLGRVGRGEGKKVV